MGAQLKQLFGEENIDYLMSLNVGDYSRIFEGPLGYHICQIVYKKDQHIRPFQEVKDQIINYFLMYEQQKIQQDTMKKIVDDLRSKASIVYYNDEYKN